VIAQIALALVPLVVAGLFTRTLEQASKVSPGFAEENLLVTSLNLGQLGNDPVVMQASAQRLLETARTLPGVESATLASRMPLGLGSLGTYVQFENAATPPTNDNGFFASLTFADPGYFSTLKIPLLAGRAFDDADRSDAPAVAILNETLARSLFGDPAEAVGREIKRGKASLRVVGVSRDVKYSRLWEEPRSQFYLPLAQTSRPRLVLAVRTTGGSAALTQTLFSALHEAQPDLPLSPPLPGSEQTAITLFPQRLGAKVASALGGLCLLLAAVGLYSVIALGAVGQAREFGIRAALGAQRADLLALVARRVVWITAAGTLAGSALAVGVARLLQGFLHGVGSVDFATYGGVTVLLAVVSLFAAALPAWRASRADPAVALRAE
jgi:predicted permease